MRVSVGFYQSGPVAEAVRLARLAESLGFYGVWFNDAQCRWRDVYVTLGAVAISTQRVRIGVSVTNPLTRHPTVTASAMYTLQELSHGRARMGLGIGEAAVKDIGQRPVTIAHLGRTVGQLRSLWEGGAVGFTGQPSRLRYAASAPCSIPIYLGGAGPRLTRLAGELADGILLTAGAEPENVQLALSHVAEGARAAGRRLEEVSTVARIPACVSDDADAKRYVRSRVGFSVLQRLPPNLTETEQRAIERIRAAYKQEEHLSPNASYAEHVTDSLVKRLALAGPPEECFERIRALAQTGIDELNVTLMHPDTETLLQTIARHILQKL